MRRQYLITGAGALFAALAIAWGRGLKGGADAETVYRALCDGCFVVGIILVCFGVLFWVSTTGFFDALSYGFQGLWYRLTAFVRDRERQTYYEYKMTREQRRMRIYRVPLLTGAGLMVLSVAFLLLWQSAV